MPCSRSELGQTASSTMSARPQIMPPDTSAAAARSCERRSLAGPRRQQPLGELPQRLAAHRVGGLDGERVERPEAVLGQPEQRTPAEPADDDDDHEQDRRPEACERRCKLARKLAEPDRGDDRRDPEHQTRHHHQQREGHQQLRQADLRQQAAGERQQRAALGAGGVILDVAAARIDGRLQAAPPEDLGGHGIPPGKPRADAR